MGRDLIIHNWPVIGWPVTADGIAVLYALIYSALLLLAACLLFRRRALN